jgi:hypothetical protein
MDREMKWGSNGSVTLDFVEKSFVVKVTEETLINVKMPHVIVIVNKEKIFVTINKEHPKFKAFAVVRNVKQLDQKYERMITALYQHGVRYHELRIFEVDLTTHVVLVCFKDRQTTSLFLKKQLTSIAGIYCGKFIDYTQVQAGLNSSETNENSQPNTNGNRDTLMSEAPAHGKETTAREDTNSKPKKKPRTNAENE